MALNRQPRATQKEIIKNAQKNLERIKANEAKRKVLASEYNSLVQQGKIKAPSRIEELIKTARGHADNASVQAARRVLEKRGIKW